MPIEVKTEIIPVRVTPSQSEKIRAKAEQDGERVSTWLRELALREAGKAA